MEVSSVAIVTFNYLIIVMNISHFTAAQPVLKRA